MFRQSFNFLRINISLFKVPKELMEKKEKRSKKKKKLMAISLFRGRKILVTPLVVRAIMHAILHCYVMKNEWREILSVMTLNL